MQWVELRYDALFTSLAGAGVRYLVIGRRALVLLGATVQTFDVDIFLAPDREALRKLLDVASKLGLEIPELDIDKPPPFLKLYADNSHVDCFRARAYRTRDGEDLFFENMWSNRQIIRQGEIEIPIPTLDDLIRTKRLRQEGSPKAQSDEADIRYLIGAKELLTRKRPV